VRVQQAIEKLGYRPNAIAQSMRRRSTHMIGRIIRDINIPVLADFVRAARDVLDEAGYSLLISNSDGRQDRERELLNRLNSQQAEGILFGPYTPIDLKFEQFLRSLDMPIVLVDRDQPEWADCVMADHASSVREATARLLRLGHRRIALLTGQPTIYPARERVRGYREAYAAKGLEVDSPLTASHRRQRWNPDGRRGDIVKTNDAHGLGDGGRAHRQARTRSDPIICRPPSEPQRPRPSTEAKRHCHEIGSASRFGG
jgi:DNA-binding LacI/PurR family transcriptional regulator